MTNSFLVALVFVIYGPQPATTLTNTLTTDIKFYTYQHENAEVCEANKQLLILSFKEQPGKVVDNKLIHEIRYKIACEPNLAGNLGEG